MEKIQFKYFRGNEVDQYSFYRIPKVLFRNNYFKNLSCEAKVLYGLLLDRTSLSIRNRWLDEEDRVYIIFTIEEVSEMLNCGVQKAVSRKGYWRMAKVLNQIFSNKIIAKLGYTSMLDYYLTVCEN